MLGRGKGARAYQHRMTLTKSEATVDWAGHASFSAPADVKEVYGAVSQMSSTKTLMTFQQANVIGLDIEFRNPGVEFNGIRYKGHEIHFSQPENADERGRVLKIQGWYQIDAPELI